MSGSRPEGAELFTIELSHDKARLTRPRLSDVGTVDAGHDRDRDRDSHGRFAAGNRAGQGRGAKRALRAPQRAAKRRIREALAQGVTPAVADQLMVDALAIHGTAMHELGTTSVFVEGPAIAYATQSVLAGFFMEEAARVGLLTDRGLKLHERAMQCETHAQRAMVAALAACKVVNRRKPRTVTPGRARVEAAAARLLPGGGKS